MKILKTMGRAMQARCAQALCCALIAYAFFGATSASAQQQPPVKGEIKVTTDNGYARLLLTLAEEVESNVRVNGGIIIISFKRPVDVVVDRINASAPTYISASRRDPDGMGIRIALARKVTVNTMAASERLFVDLLPDPWTGMPPGLPKEVIEELARRAREAEKILRHQRASSQPRAQPPIRVRVATQPTFTRYVFDLPASTSVSTEREKDQLTLVFASPLKFDLADVKATLPPVVDAVDQDVAQTSTAVRFAFNKATEVRAFRDENSYLVDVSLHEAKATRFDPAAKLEEAAGEAAPKPTEAPQTIPAKAPEAAPQPERPAPVPPEKSSAAPPAASQNVAAPRQAAVAPAPETPAPAKAAPPAPEMKPPAQLQPVERPKPAAAPEPAGPPMAAATSPAAPAPQSIPVAPLESTEPQPAAQAQVPLTEQTPPADYQLAAAPQPAAAMAAPAAAAQPPAPEKIVKETEPARAAASQAPGAVPVEIRRQGDDVKLIFPFQAAVPAAMFRRADSVWLVFDTPNPIDLRALNADPSRTIRSASVTAVDKAQLVRILLERPRLVSVLNEADSWQVTIGDAVAEPSRPLGIARNIAGSIRSSITIPFDEPGRLHRFIDPDIGDTLLVVSALGPARGFPKTQDFVELRALASSHGVVVQPLADDLAVELSADKILIARPGGLTLSNVMPATRNSVAYRPMVFDAQLWGVDRESNFNDRQFKLLNAAAEAPESKRFHPRLDLARFYLARELYTEAKAVLDVTLADDRATAEDPTALVLHAVTNIMLNRPDHALKDLSSPIIGNQHDAPLWRALAYARQGRWKEAREGFKSVANAINTLPVELQRLALKQAMRASIEVGDFASAATVLSELEATGVPRELEAELSVLNGRLAQGFGKNQDALAAYRRAAESPNRPASAQGRLREIVLRYELGDLKPNDVITDLETLTAIWRGDETEIEALQLLARLYTQADRYRDAFQVMRTALTAHPNSDMTRRIHDEAAATFDSLFLAGKGDTMPAIDALSLFYDFRELTPIGRRGDEMIRRLADRLVSVDLLTQASELLQHQIEHRLQGAARAQVATRLAVIHLMNHKPERAQAILKSTRLSDLGGDLRNLRLMLEARALADIGRHDVALEIIADMNRPEAIRLRSDIYWVARRFRESAEQIELLYGDRWREWEPLNPVERADILRAAVGFALSEDSIGLTRLREKYSAKMAEGADRNAFEVATAPIGAGPAEFGEIAKAVAGLDTLEGFLRELRGRYPEIGTLSPVAAAKPVDSAQKLAKTDGNAPAPVQ